MVDRTCKTGDSGLLFFIIIFLLLFYDGTAIEMPCKGAVEYGYKGDSSILFFILVFLLLFY